jgi:hypothetical protein
VLFNDPADPEQLIFRDGRDRNMASMAGVYRASHEAPGPQLAVGKSEIWPFQYAIRARPAEDTLRCVSFRVHPAQRRDRVMDVF